MPGQTQNRFLVGSASQDAIFLLELFNLDIDNFFLILIQIYLEDVMLVLLRLHGVT